MTHTLHMKSSQVLLLFIIFLLQKDVSILCRCRVLVGSSIAQRCGCPFELFRDRHQLRPQLQRSRKLYWPFRLISAYQDIAK